MITYDMFYFFLRKKAEHKIIENYKKRYPKKNKTDSVEKENRNHYCPIS